MPHHFSEVGHIKVHLSFRLFDNIFTHTYAGVPYHQPLLITIHWTLMVLGWIVS